MTIARYAAGIALALGVATQPAAAQDEWVQQVRRQLQEAGQTYENNGYSMTHDIYTGSLDQAASDTVTLDLNIGMSYQILGVCDNDCTDLDATLYDGSGNQIDADVANDDFPIVSVTASRSGTFSVRVYMASCSAQPCRYGLAVFGK